ncbi:MAG: hypothetical protein GF364_22780 [Candidatus Lokiarchaeota archaeon]|nr:hypothetical protein [Candidatus Lokiarchaeota archaeon]
MVRGHSEPTQEELDSIPAWAQAGYKFWSNRNENPDDLRDMLAEAGYQ